MGKTSENQNDKEIELNKCPIVLDNVPLAFILLITAELNGGSRKALMYMMSALFIFRLGHVECGLYGPDNASLGRPLGYFGTNGVLARLTGYTAWLVRGYWGFDS